MDTSTITEHDEQPGWTRRVGRLQARIAESRHLRALSSDPDLLAVTIEKVRRRTTTGLYFFLTLGLAFTTTGVQRFLADGTSPADPLWWAAWCVEPMLAGLLIVLLNFEAVITTHGVNTDSVWFDRLKWLLLAATLFMNVTPEIRPLWTGTGVFNLGAAVMHVLVPLVIFGLAEVLPVVQARLIDVIHTGYATANRIERSQPAPVAAPAPVSGAAAADVPPPKVKLPPALAATVRKARHAAEQEGRAFTAADVQAAVKVPDDLAAKIAAEPVAA